MRKCILVLLSLVAYFGLGWVFKDILLSIVTIDADTTLSTLYFYEIVMYIVITGIICVLCYFNSECSAPIYVVGALGYVMYAGFLPLSMGLAILFNVINIGCMIWAIIMLKS